MNTDTPETDSLDWSCAYQDTAQTKALVQVNLQHARTLERQRDEARRKLEKVAHHLGQALRQWYHYYDAMNPDDGPLDKQKHAESEFYRAAKQALKEARE